MAANDELPRGWVQSANNTGSAASLTYPAIPGISWVVTNISAMMVIGTAGPSGFAAIEINTVWVVGIGMPVGSAVDDVETAEWSGELAFPPDTAVVVAFSSGFSNLVEQLTVEAYPI